MEQNTSLSGKKIKEPETVCRGYFRATSIDSIIELIKDLKDKSIYRSRGLLTQSNQYISISYDTIEVKIELHNASDTIAEKVVNILNSNLPADRNPLMLFHE